MWSAFRRGNFRLRADANVQHSGEGRPHGVLHGGCAGAKTSEREGLPDIQKHAEAHPVLRKNEPVREHLDPQLCFDEQAHHDRERDLGANHEDNAEEQKCGSRKRVHADIQSMHARRAMEGASANQP